MCPQCLLLDLEKTNKNHGTTGTHHLIQGSHLPIHTLNLLFSYLV